MGRRSEGIPLAGAPAVSAGDHDEAPAVVERVVRLVWVQAALLVLLGLVGALVDGVMSTALTSTNALGERVVPSSGLVAVTVTAHLLGVSVVVVAALVLARSLRRGHRWTRVAVLVLAVVRGIGLVTAVLATAVYVVGGASLLVPTPPPWWSTLGAALSAALFARMLVDLHRPAVRTWLDARGGRDGPAGEDDGRALTT